MFETLEVAYLHFDQVIRHLMHLNKTMWVEQIGVYLLHCVVEVWNGGNKARMNT